MNKSKLVSKIFVAVSLLATGGAAFAEGVDLTTVTSAFVPTNIVNAVLAIGATLAGIYAAIKGVKIVLAMFRGS